MALLVFCQKEVIFLHFASIFPIMHQQPASFEYTQMKALCIADRNLQKIAPTM